MTKSTLALCFSLACLGTSTAHATIQVDFSEGAPKDRFTMSNQGQCTLKNTQVDLDLSKSQGKLIFDITAAGAGVEVFQPFEVTEGKLRLAPGTSVKDGDSSISLLIESLKPNQRVSFTIDVDDTLPQGALGMIRVADSEIKGGVVSVKRDDQETVSAAFNDDSTARIPMSGC